MRSTIQYNHVVEDVEKLTLEEQESLVKLLHQRVMERRRAELAIEIQDARNEFQNGKATPATPNELANEMIS